MNAGIKSLVLGLVVGMSATLAGACTGDDCDCGPSSVEEGSFSYEWQTENPDFPDMSGGTVVVGDGTVRLSYAETVVKFVRIDESAGGAGGVGGATN